MVRHTQTHRQSHTVKDTLVVTDHTFWRDPAQKCALAFWNLPRQQEADQSLSIFLFYEEIFSLEPLPLWFVVGTNQQYFLLLLTLLPGEASTPFCRDGNENQRAAIFLRTGCTQFMCKEQYYILQFMQRVMHSIVQHHVALIFITPWAITRLHKDI